VLVLLLAASVRRRAAGEHAKMAVCECRGAVARPPLPAEGTDRRRSASNGGMDVGCGGKRCPANAHAALTLLVNTHGEPHAQISGPNPKP
jgi:hypothetical protein